MTTISLHGPADSGTIPVRAAYSRGGVALFACGACLLGFLAASAFNASGESGIANASPPAALKGGRTQPNENEVLQGILSDLTTLKQENDNLREEVETLIKQNGIIDKLIGHMRDLQGADREILALIKTQDPDEPRPAEGKGELDPPIAAFVKHEVVTPKAAKQIGQPPVPEKRPAGIQKGEITEAKGSSPG